MRVPGASRVVVSVALIGVVITAGLAWAAGEAHADNEQRLTDQRSAEVISVLTAAVPSIEIPLASAAALVEAESDPELFEEVIGPQLGPEERFVSASVWRADASTPEVTIGARPALADLAPSEIEAFLDRSLATDLMSIVDLVDGSEPRIGYSYTAPGGRAEFVVYAEQMLPENRTSTVPDDSAFADIDFALYLDTAERSGTLLVASTDELPLDGTTAEDTAPFGDSELRAVVTPNGDLGGELLARLPWLIALTGLIFTAAAAGTTAVLQRRRHQAETLARENAALYEQQHAASLTLQQSLLPRTLPPTPGLDVAVRYATGVQGTEVGGDWYDIVDVGARTILIVGDVSGRGLTAASVMAGVRHAIRTLAIHGDAPKEILAKVNRPDLVDLAGHFVTVLCVELDREAGRIGAATAGHPPPLLLDGHNGAFACVPVGPPIGVVAPTGYETGVFPFGPGGTVLLFTDGLFERRGETIDDGLERLRLASVGHAGNAQELVERVFDQVSGDLLRTTRCSLR